VDTKIENVTLKMWEKTMMPETSLQDGKRIKTGNKLEFTTYTFTDSWGAKLTFLTQSSEYRKFEGETGDLILSLAHDDFRKRNRVLFKGFVAR